MFIDTFKQMKRIQQENTKLRGDFINRNIDGVKSKDWTVVSRINHEKLQAASLKRQHLESQQRQEKLFQLQKQAVLKKIKEDWTIDTKNWIMQRCRHANYRGHIVMIKVVKLVYQRIQLRRTQILDRLKSRWALALIVNIAVKALMKRVKWQPNNIRFVFTVATSIKSNTFNFEEKAKNLIKKFLTKKAEFYTMT